MNQKKKLSLAWYHYVIVLLIFMWGIGIIGLGRVKKSLEYSYHYSANLSKVLNMTSSEYLRSIQANNTTYILKDTIFSSSDQIFVTDDYLNYKSSIFFFFSESACNPCIKRELHNIKEKRQEGVPVLIIGKYTTYRNLHTLLTKYDLTDNFVSIGLGESPFVGDKEMMNLFYAIIDTNHTIHDIFIPVQLNDSLSTQYLESASLNY